MAKIYLSTETDGGVFALVDDEDFGFLNQWQWRLGSEGYAIRSMVIDGKPYMRRMHRIVADSPDGLPVDHINGDRLDNRRENLRTVTPRQNCLNRSRNEKRAKGVLFKGVYQNTKASTFTARINTHGKSRYLGSFPTQEAAARAYDAAAVEYHGEFARLNFPKLLATPAGLEPATKPT